MNLAEIRASLVELPGVSGVHDMHVWALTSGFNAMSLHIVRTQSADHDEVLTRAREHITHRFKVQHVTVQVEPTACAEQETHL